MKIKELNGRSFGCIVAGLREGDLGDASLREYLRHLWIERGLLIFRALCGLLRWASKHGANGPTMRSLVPRRRCSASIASSHFGPVTSRRVRMANALCFATKTYKTELSN